jgi:hypothetical protein
MQNLIGKGTTPLRINSTLRFYSGQSTRCVFYASLESCWQDLSNDTSHDGVLKWPQKRPCRSYNGHNVHKLYIVGKLLTRPFQRYVTWGPMFLKRIWPLTVDGEGIVRFRHKNKLEPTSDPFCEIPKRDFENIEPFKSYSSRTDRQTDILVIRIKGFTT